MAECGSVALTSHSAGFQAASLFIFTQFLGVHEQRRTCKKKNAREEKSKLPSVLFFNVLLLYNGYIF